MSIRTSHGEKKKTTQSHTHHIQKEGKKKGWEDGTRKSFITHEADHGNGKDKHNRLEKK